MKGIRFYLEHNNRRDKRQGNHNGNVLAVIVVNGYWIRDNGVYQEAIGALTGKPNSVVCGVTVSDSYLRERCKRIGEGKARTIHPNLFLYLDEVNQ